MPRADIIFATCPMPPSDNDPRKYQKRPDLKAALERRLLGQKLKQDVDYDVIAIVDAQWSTRKGKRRKRDVMNYTKLFLDVVCEVVDMDDSQFNSVTMRKGKETSREQIRLTISPAMRP